MTAQYTLDRLARDRAIIAKRPLELSAYVTTLWEPEMRGKVRGYRVDFHVKFWEAGVFGLKWRTELFSGEFALETTDIFAAVAFKRALRMYWKRFQKLPDLYGLAARMRLR